MASTTAYPRRQSRGIGCWLTTFVTLFVAFVLVVVGLFLPPFDLYNRFFGEQFITLDARGQTLAAPDGGFNFTLAADPQDDFGARLSGVSLQNFEAANASAGDWIPAVKNAVPYYLALQSPVYSIRTTGADPSAVLLSMRLPGNARADLLDMYGWIEAGQGGTWEFIPTTANGNRLETVTERIPEHVAIFQAVPDVPEVLVAYDVTQVLTPAVADVATIVTPAGLQPLPDGTLTGGLAGGFSTNADYRLMPVIRDFSDPRALAIDTQTVSTILANSTLRQTHARQLALSASSNGYDGIFIDYRGVTPDQRENFVAFMRQLNAELDAVGRSLGVVVPAPQNVDGIWQTGAYDWRALGAEVDHFQINLGINPTLYANGRDQFVDAMTRWATSEVNRYKILLNMTAQSIREIAGTYTSIGYDEALAGLGDVVVEADNVSETGTILPGSEIRARLDGRQARGGVEAGLNTPYLDYVDEAGNVTARMWITTGNALRFRMDKSTAFALGGVAFDDLLEDDRATGVLAAIDAYRTQIPTTPVTAEWALRWRLVSTAGEVVDEITTDLNEQLTVTLAAPDGNYAVNPAVVLRQEDREDESIRSGAQVALFQSTPTPTPLPTATPTPTPTVTPTPRPIVATAVPAGGTGGGVTNFNANPAGAGRIVAGQFELGGHVTSASSAVAIRAMRQSGMTWMKVQVRYYPGGPLEDAARTVQNAQANGFKILVGTVGNPNDLAAGGDAYVRDYANWLGRIAALGADAIEVWNEPNIFREWPEGQISGTAYTEMLRLGYQAIKRSNPNTMVISAALAPTGAEAAFPGRVRNDDNYLREMVNAGALQYADCVGIHYNEGIVPPTVTSNDPRGDNFYTRYYQTMINTYWNIIGGQRPLCFTELGYLTPEGFPPLPSGFAWAQNVTLSQQAAWLAQAAALSSQSGRVRMMIVWNVDFGFYGADPQAGYAMVRPDGSCPACQALANAR